MEFVTLGDERISKLEAADIDAAIKASAVESKTDRDKVKKAIAGLLARRLDFDVIEVKADGNVVLKINNSFANHVFNFLAMNVKKPENK